MAAWVNGGVVGERVCWLCRCGLFGLFCGCFALLWAFVLICVWFGWLGVVTVLLFWDWLCVY